MTPKHKNPTVMSYGGKRNGKTSYGNLGFGGRPVVDYVKISQEKWDAIFGKKEEKKE